MAGCRQCWRRSGNEPQLQVIGKKEKKNKQKDRKEKVSSEKETKKREKQQT